MIMAAARKREDQTSPTHFSLGPRLSVFQLQAPGHLVKSHHWVMLLWWLLFLFALQLSSRLSRLHCCSRDCDLSWSMFSSRQSEWNVKTQVGSKVKKRKGLSRSESESTFHSQDVTENLKFGWSQAWPGAGRGHWCMNRILLKWLTPFPNQGDTGITSFNHW